MALLAFMTFAVLKEPYGSPVVQGFVDAVEDTFAEAEKSEGYIAHAVKPVPEKPKFGQVFGAFGELVAPRFYKGGKTFGTTTSAETLSLWTGIEPVRRFAYGGLHKNALARRSEWFVKPEWPSYVMWWVPDEHVPSWREASDRLEHLHDQGPTSHAFNFRKAFDPN
jgi:hypothetical protein